MPASRHGPAGAGCPLRGTHDSAPVVRMAGDFGQDQSFRAADARQQARLRGGYEWRPSSDPAFFPGRQAEVLFKGRVRRPGPASLKRLLTGITLQNLRAVPAASLAACLRSFT